MTNLKTARLARGLTLREIAGELGVSIPYVSDLENGRRDIPLHRLGDIAEVYGIDPETMIGDFTDKLPKGYRLVKEAAAA